MIAQNKRKLENLENPQIWHARLGHISQDKMKSLMDSKSLEIDNLDNLPAYVCGLLNTQARGGFSYFIIFTDHSRCGYVYLTRYKSEGFVRSARVLQPLERYGFLGLTSQLGNDPKTYGEMMLDIDSGKWLEAMKSEGLHELEPSLDAKLMAKGYTQRPRVDFKEKNFPRSHGQVHMDYACHSSVPEGFTVVEEEQKVCRLQRSIYGLKQASRSWNIRFDEVIWGYDFVKNDFDPCVYKKVSGSFVCFPVLYEDNILLIRNDIKMLGDTKEWLST
ncbi:UNVERIFIED_CONTAM: Retrovirus-related Pol polyprotein from transposon TNT 1-94 [Sesamum calycinum]|uniref:Retrovirus-related Pol polyprotein from transposon TNT 1-94 n=1 Tax=Sesamum calycinum TaxID=2727403 RepID=A0AAW2JMI6_9LAMI